MEKTDTNYLERYKEILSKNKCFQIKGGSDTIPEIKHIFENLDVKKYMKLPCEAYLLGTFFSKSEQQRKFRQSRVHYPFSVLKNDKHLPSGAELDIWVHTIFSQGVTKVNELIKPLCDKFCGIDDWAKEFFGLRGLTRVFSKLRMKRGKEKLWEYFKRLNSLHSDTKTVDPEVKKLREKINELEQRIAAKEPKFKLREYLYHDGSGGRPPVNPNVSQEVFWWMNLTKIHYHKLFQEILLSALAIFFRNARQINELETTYIRRSM